MPLYEYKVVPAPNKGLKAKGLKGTDARFAHALAELMNEHGAEGWEYLRAETLPCDERSGLRGSKTTYQNMLVFRRELEVEPAKDADDTETAATPAFLATAGVDGPEPNYAPAVEVNTDEGDAPAVNTPKEDTRED